MRKFRNLRIPDLGRLLLLLGLAILPGIAASAFLDQHRHRTSMHKVQLTQKGYIQFLRWELPVPEITEFTFCLWIVSDDLTHPHPVFSYSRNERDRLARSWISSRGRTLNLEIDGKRVFAGHVDIREDRWHHVCVSWENRLGRHGLWLDGRLASHGRSAETIGHAIPGGGDIVLGQEYTDFDKGLEDGIEGSVFGFNLLLASAFHQPQVRPFPPLLARILTALTHRELAAANATAAQPLGLQLVTLSYARCDIGRGSPFIGGPRMLISWTRTPVRVFGGAVLKNVNGDCGKF